MSVLLLGDENLTFAGCLLQQLRAEGHGPKLTVTVTLAAESVREEVLQRANALTAAGVSVLFGASPLQLKTENFGSRFQEFVAVLPGLPFHG
ncbi:hypothetical protein, conserved [Eimeria necatrix]|uniref:Uncharacterized protein n=2 Tax=Eimeria TaxID=5800 RepID=U6MPV6_9EIME